MGGTHWARMLSRAAPCARRRYMRLPRKNAQPANPDAPIKLSYLDVVVEGFAQEFGLDGVARFFDTTTGWGPVLDDRTAPLYPRARPVAPALRRLVDDQLANMGVERLSR